MKKLEKPVEAVIFDLDYTLYDMDMYLTDAFKVVVKTIAFENDMSQSLLADQLEDCCRQYGVLHDKLFNLWLDKAKIANQMNIDLAISSFHNVKTLNIAPYHGAEPVVEYLSEKYKLGILTDGRSQTQSRKLKALGIEKYFNGVVFTHDLNTSKPDRLCFEKASEKLGVELSKSVFVGDHPNKDIRGAIESEMIAVRVYRGAFKNELDVEGFSPDYKIDDITELKDIL